MIEFLQDYTTKAIPPESFERGQQVKRSEDSELYFVRLGVAAYVTENGLVGEDYRPIVPASTVAEVVTPGDRRFAMGGRAGELALGLDAPQRATSGPGNILLAGGDQQTAAAQGELERLIAELADANAEGDDLAKASEALKSELAAERQAHTATRDELSRVQTDLGAAETGRAEAEKTLEAANQRVAELEQQLAEATKPAVDQGADDGTSAKTGKAAK
ncbi:hypothetical protein SUS17_2104 [Sphingomonas sp. S17]|uniref:hypothetical protein n=1 Tax=Sphingomonas sp. S17 TaxID=1007104 RepID=UPI00020A25F7|nr:hypothetical protein [Sphingomonas sp. S17]EGI55012.1 hypothetical protein SUS17_2104 [Sphingomonas sp. S17]